MIKTFIYLCGIIIDSMGRENWITKENISKLRNKLKKVDVDSSHFLEPSILDVKIHPLIFSKYVCDILNQIYSTEINRWFVYKVDDYIILCFGKYPELKTDIILDIVIDIEHDNNPLYLHSNGYDIFALKLKKYTYLYAKMTANKIFSDLKNAGF